MEASEAALLKLRGALHALSRSAHSFHLPLPHQVKGLQAEYMRVADNKAPAGSAEAKAEADVEALRSAARAAEVRAGAG